MIDKLLLQRSSLGFHINNVYMEALSSADNITIDCIGLLLCSNICNNFAHMIILLHVIQSKY